jgi:CBS domain-containing protein
VVSKEGELVGILTLDDLLDVLAEAFNDLVLLTGREQRRERETRGQSEKNRT